MTTPPNATRNAHRSNCLVFALWRCLTRDGYLIIRTSRLYWWLPHFLWSPDLKRFESFVPMNPKVRPPCPFWFKGYVKEGDE